MAYRWVLRRSDEQVFHATAKVYRYNFDVWMGSVDDGRSVQKDSMVMMTQDDAMRSSAQTQLSPSNSGDR